MPLPLKIGQYVKIHPDFKARIQYWNCKVLEDEESTFVIKKIVLKMSNKEATITLDRPFWTVSDSDYRTNNNLDPVDLKRNLWINSQGNCSLFILVDKNGKLEESNRLEELFGDDLEA